MVYPPLSLAVAGFVAGLTLLVLCAAGLLRIETVRGLLPKMARARGIGIALLTVAAAWSWVLLRTMDLGEFSNLRFALLLLVPTGYVLTLLYVEDFLTVRAVGMLLLLMAEPLLEAAFLKPQGSRIVLVVLAYAMIVKGMFWVGMPYLFRDAVDWTVRSTGRVRLGLAGGLAYGLILLALSATAYRS